jgi:hypothetical protein
MSKVAKGIPQTYDMKKILEALIQVLVKENILKRSQVNLIIEKCKPKSIELRNSLTGHNKEQLGLGNEDSP